MQVRFVNSEKSKVLWFQLFQTIFHIFISLQCSHTHSTYHTHTNKQMLSQLIKSCCTLNRISRNVIESLKKSMKSTTLCGLAKSILNPQKRSICGIFSGALWGIESGVEWKWFTFIIFSIFLSPTNEQCT